MLICPARHQDHRRTEFADDERDLLREILAAILGGVDEHLRARRTIETRVGRAIRHPALSTSSSGCGARTSSRVPSGTDNIGGATSDCPRRAAAAYTFSDTSKAASDTTVEQMSRRRMSLAKASKGRAARAE